MRVARQIETAVSRLADAAWRSLQVVNRRVPSGSCQPAWAPAPAQKSWERTTPPLGWPRETDSLCPTCVRETRARILSGALDVNALVNEHIGEIQARLFERDGAVVIEKTCPEHGTFSDVLSINPSFLARF